MDSQNLMLLRQVVAKASPVSLPPSKYGTDLAIALELVTKLCAYAGTVIAPGTVETVVCIDYATMAKFDLGWYAEATVLRSQHSISTGYVGHLAGCRILSDVRSVAEINADRVLSPGVIYVAIHTHATLVNGDKVIGSVVHVLPSSTTADRNPL